MAAILLGACANAPDRFRSNAARLASEVDDGALNDCEALARFVDVAAAGGEQSLIEGLSVFIPRGKANYPLGFPIDLVGVEQPVKFESSKSGYRAEFRKGHEPGRLEGTAHDQAHHFAPYFVLGARTPRWIAERFLELAERPESWGDLNLGREAIELGAAWAEGRLDSVTLGPEVRARLCNGPLSVERK